MIFPVLIGALLIYVAVGLSFNFHVVLERMISKAFRGERASVVRGPACYGKA